jgi:hypothetical protein
MDIITFDLETTWREIRNQLEKPLEGIDAYLEVAAPQAKPCRIHHQALSQSLSVRASGHNGID